MSPGPTDPKSSPSQQCCPVAHLSGMMIRPKSLAILAFPYTRGFNDLVEGSKFCVPTYVSLTPCRRRATPKTHAVRTFPNCFTSFRSSSCIVVSKDGSNRSSFFGCSNCSEAKTHPNYAVFNSLRFSPLGALLEVPTNLPGGRWDLFKDGLFLGFLRYDTKNMFTF